MTEYCDHEVDTPHFSYYGKEDVHQIIDAALACARGEELQVKHIRSQIFPNPGILIRMAVREAARRSVDDAEKAAGNPPAPSTNGAAYRLDTADYSHATQYREMVDLLVRNIRKHVPQMPDDVLSTWAASRTPG